MKQQYVINYLVQKTLKPKTKKLILFNFIFISLSLAQNNCHPDINSEKNNYIIGYGSLMQKSSREKTTPEIKSIYPITIAGYQRIWGVADKKNGISYLAITKNKNSKLNAAYYKVSPQQILKTDDRELFYCREKINSRNINSLSAKSLDNGDYWAYVIPKSKIILPSSENPLVQSYVDIFLDGCFQIEYESNITGFAQDCYTTTVEWPEKTTNNAYWINDREAPKRPAQILHYKEIDQLLSSQTTNNIKKQP